MTDVHVVEGSFTHPELTARYRPYPIAGRGTVKITPRGVELEGLEPARGLPPLLKGCVLLMCLYLPIWLPVFLLRGTEPSLPVTEILTGLGGLVGIVLLSRYVLRLTRKSREGRPDRPRRVRLPWKRVWSIGLEGNLLEVRRKARRQEMRFRSTRAPEEDGTEPGSVSVLVGHWGGRRLVTFVPDSDLTALRDHLEGMRVTSGA
jgi:hypothetical protein